MKKVRFLSIAMLAALALFLVACSSEEEPTSTPMPEPTATQVPTAVSTPPPTRAARPTPSSNQAQVAPELLQTPERTGDEKPTGGIFRRLWADPPTLDPALVTDGTSYAIVIELFSGLVKLTGESDDPIAMDLAESYSVSNGGKTYKFVLRDDLRFSDGSPLTASDFKWSWERAAAPDTESPIVDEFLGDIIGVQEIIDGDATTAEGNRGYRRPDASGNNRCSETLLHRQVDVSHRLRRQRRQRYIGWRQLDRRSCRHRPVRA